MGKSTKRPVIVSQYPVGSRVGYVWPGGGLANSGFGTVTEITYKMQLVLDNGLKFTNRGHEVSKTGANRLLIDPVELETLLHDWNRDQKLRVAAVCLARSVADLISNPRYISGDDQSHDVLIDSIMMCNAVLVRAVHGAE